jgi:hypothetical protein
MVLTAVCAAGCASPSPAAQDEQTGAPDSSGISREEYCSSKQAMVTDVSAARAASGVVVSWRDIYGRLEPVTYRVYRRPGPSADWARVAEFELAQTSLRRYVDASPPPTRLDYAVTSLGECGESPLCTFVNVGERCSVASVDPATKQR